LQGRKIPAEITAFNICFEILERAYQKFDEKIKVETYALLKKMFLKETFLRMAVFRCNNFLVQRKMLQYLKLSKGAHILLNLFP